MLLFMHLFKYQRIKLKYKYIYHSISKYHKMEFRRKLYKRGSSIETTIPKPILFALDLGKKHNVVFKYDQKRNRWYIEFEVSKR